MKIVRNKGVLENSINIYNLPHEPVRNAAGERRVSESDTCKMNYDNLKFPKQGKKKRKKPKPGKYLCKKQKNSIIEGDEKGTCYICGSHINIENHHIFFGHGNRKNSDWYGLTVHLCAQHHKEDRISAHKYREVNYALKRIAQRTFESKISSREDFMKIFGENCLEEEYEKKNEPIQDRRPKWKTDL